MKDLVPLFQTVAWIGFLVWIFLRFDGIIRLMLDAIQKRLHSDDIDIWKFKLTRPIPATNEEQATKLENEVAEIKKSEPEIARPNGSAGIRLRYLAAEDLVMRQLQAEYGVPINRQLNLGGALADGFFVKDGDPCMVEAKLAIGPISEEVINRSTKVIARAVEILGWKRFRAILAIVYDNETIDLDAERNRIAPLVDKFSFPIEIRCFRLSELEKNTRGVVAHS